jgi:hypothetical protein
MKKDSDMVLDHETPEKEAILEAFRKETCLVFDFEFHAPEDESGALEQLEQMIFGAVYIETDELERMDKLVNHFSKCTFEPVQR